MPTKMMIMVKRRPDLTPEEFRHGYENYHSRLGVELFGHLWAEYRRNYIVKGHAFAQRGQGSMDGPDEIGFDAISEVVFKYDDSLQQMAVISAANRDRIVEDEARWFHQKRCWMVTVDTMEEDLSVTQ
jgi:hypothetical protein